MTLASVLLLAACMGGEGQSGWEQVVSGVSRQVAPLVSEYSPGLGKQIESFDTSPEHQVELAEANATAIERQTRRVDDPDLEAYLTEMARRLAGDRGSEHWDYRVAVVESEELNAFTVGAGRLYVTTGLVRALKNEAQMAMVLGHEIAHVTQGHAARALRDEGAMAVAAAKGKELLLTTDAAKGARRGYAAKTADLGLGALVSGYGRQQEDDADRVGLEYMVAGGYDPRAAPEVFEAFQARYGDQTAIANFLHGDHPTNERRIQMLKWIVNANYATLPGKPVRNTDAYRRVVVRYKR